MKLLITGGFGFVGSQLLHSICHRSDLDITVIDNLLTRPDMRLFSHINKNITFINGDIRDQNLMKQLLKSNELIVHLAGIVGFPSCDIDKKFSFDVNVTAMYSMLKLMDNSQRIIFMSSTSAYGDKPGVVVTEESPLTPLTSYGVHKKIGELLITSRLMDYIIFRPATSFGVSKQIRVDVLPNTLCYDALTKKHLEVFQPEVTRTFIHISDFANAIAYAIDGKMPWNEIYNIGNPDLTVSKGSLAKEIAKLAKVQVTLKEGFDPDRRNYDVSFAKMLNTGFTPVAGFRRGFGEIQNNLDKIMRNPERYTTPSNVKRYLRHAV